MAVKTYRPTSPGRRDMTGHSFEEITRTRPERSLLRPLSKRAGRNFRGKITVRHQGGGHKRRYRVIDFKRKKIGIEARVTSIEYDPNRSARIALLTYADGEKRYIIAPLGVRVDDVLVSGPEAEIRPGNALPIAKIPLGMQIHNIELQEGRGGQMVRSAGTSARVLAKEGSYAQVRGRVVWLRLGRWETLTTGISSWARRAASGGSASARQFEVRQCRRGTIHMAAAKDGPRLACLGPSRPGASRHWGRGLGAISARTNTLFAGAASDADRLPR